jgi:hypothetical protein
MGVGRPTPFPTLRTSARGAIMGAWSIAPTILSTLYVCAGPRAGALSRSEGRSAGGRRSS